MRLVMRLTSVPAWLAKAMNLFGVDQPLTKDERKAHAKNLEITESRAALGEALKAHRVAHEAHSAAVKRGEPDDVTAPLREHLDGIIGEANTHSARLDKLKGRKPVKLLEPHSTPKPMPRVGLIPKKVIVIRGGKTFVQTVMIRVAQEAPKPARAAVKYEGMSAVQSGLFDAAVSKPVQETMSEPAPTSAAPTAPLETLNGFEVVRPYLGGLKVARQTRFAAAGKYAIVNADGAMIGGYADTPEDAIRAHIKAGMDAARQKQASEARSELAGRIKDNPEDAGNLMLFFGGERIRKPDARAGLAELGLKNFQIDAAFTAGRDGFNANGDDMIDVAQAVRAVSASFAPPVDAARARTPDNPIPVSGFVRLQSVGLVPGARSDTLQHGDVLMWNGGSTSAVDKVEEISKQYVNVTTIENGKPYTRKMKKDRLAPLDPRQAALSDLPLMGNAENSAEQTLFNRGVKVQAGDVQAMGNELYVGSTKSVGRVTYRLNQNHRWERVDALETEPSATQPITLVSSQPVTPEAGQVNADPAAPPIAPAPAVGVQEGTTQKQRVTDNAAARAALAAMAGEGREATPDELELIAKYSGTGGAGASTNEFYTPPELAKAMWGTLEKLGVTAGMRGLEPTCGTGVLMQDAPAGVTMRGIEMSPTSAPIAQQLFAGRHDISNSSFEAYHLENPDERFDFMIANPPFCDRGDLAMTDEPSIKRAEQYITLKSLDHLKAGGVAAVILPYGLLSSSTNRTFRQALLAKCEIIAVHGLPSSSFARAGSNAITTDVYYLRRRPADVTAALEGAGSDGLKALGVYDADFISGKWHDAHPEQSHGVLQKIGESWYTERTGDLTPATLEALTTFTPEGSRDATLSHTAEQVIEALEATNPAAAARARGMLSEREGRKEGAFRVNPDSGNGQVCRGGRWHNISNEDSASMIAAQQLEELLKTHAELIGAGDTDTANTLRPMLERSLAEHLTKHGNPHDNAEILRAHRARGHIPRLLEAVTPDGTLSPSITGAAAAIDREAFNANDLESIHSHLERRGITPTLQSIADLYAVNGLTDNELSAALQNAGYAWTGAAFAKNAEFYSGSSAQIRTALQQLAADSSGWQRDAFNAQLDTLELKAAGQRKSLEDLGVTIHHPAVTLDVAQRYTNWMGIQIGRTNEYRLERGADGKVELNANSDYLSSSNKKSLNFWKRYINNVRRMADENDLYEQIDSRFNDWLTESGHREAIEDAANTDVWLEPSWDASSVTIPGQGDFYKLRWWQIEAINRASTQGRGIIGLSVGLGKTLASIGLTIKEKREGRVSMPVMAVPTGVIAKFERDAKKLVPDAKILMVGLEPELDANGQPVLDAEGNQRYTDDTSAAKLTEQLTRARRGDFDFVLMSSQTLTRIPHAATAQLEMINEEFYTQTTGAYYRPAPGMGGKSSALFAEYARLKAEALMATGDLSSSDLENASKRLKAAQAELKTLEAAKGAKLTDLEKAAKNAKADEVARLNFLSIAARELNATRSPIGVTWEELGVDHLVVDEAHAAKGLWMPKDAELADAKYLGAGSSSTQTAMSLYFKSKDIRKRTNERGVYLLTATPMVNSPLDLYNMTYHLDPTLFHGVGVTNADDYLKRYCEFADVLIADREGGQVLKTALVGLKNLEELRGLTGRYINRKTAEGVGLELPKVNDDTTRMADVTPEQEAYFQRISDAPLQSLRDLMGIAEIPDGIENWAGSGKEVLFKNRFGDPAIMSQDEAYKLLQKRYGSTQADLFRRVETDLEMIDPAAHKGHVSPKVDALVNEATAFVARGEKGIIFGDTVNMAHPSAQLEENQAVSDGRRKNARQRTNPNGYTFHEKLRTLIAAKAGIPESQIAILSGDENASAQERLDVSDGLASGKYRIVIGNTAKMGEGVDLQHGVTNELHLDVPWNPAKMEQRGGRVVRQGNTAESVNRRVFLSSRAFDKHMYDVLQGKGNWYNAFWSGGNSMDLRDAFSDTDITPELMLTAKIADPVAREAAQTAIREKDRALKLEGQRAQLHTRFKRVQSLAVAIRTAKTKTPDDKRTDKQRADLESKQKQMENEIGLLKEHPAWDKPDWLENPENVMFDARTGKAFQIGQRLIMRDRNGVINAREVTGLNRVTNTVQMTNLTNAGAVDNRYSANHDLTALAAGDHKPYSKAAHAESIVSAAGVSSMGAMDAETMSGARAGIRTHAIRSGNRHALIRRAGQVSSVAGNDIQPDDEVLLNDGSPLTQQAVSAYLNHPDTIAQHVDLNSYGSHAKYTSPHTNAAAQGFSIDTQHDRAPNPAYTAPAAPLETPVARPTPQGSVPHNDPRSKPNDYLLASSRNPKTQQRSILVTGRQTGRDKTTSTTYATKDEIKRIAATHGGTATWDGTRSGWHVPHTTGAARDLANMADKRGYAVQNITEFQHEDIGMHDPAEYGPPAPAKSTVPETILKPRYVVKGADSSLNPIRLVLRLNGGQS